MLDGDSPINSTDLGVLARPMGQAVLGGGRDGRNIGRTDLPPQPSSV